MLHDESERTKEEEEEEEEMEDTDKLLKNLEEIPDLDQLEISDLLEKQKKVSKALSSTMIKDVSHNKLPAPRETKNKIFEGIKRNDPCKNFYISCYRYKSNDQYCKYQYVNIF